MVLPRKRNTSHFNLCLYYIVYKIFIIGKKLHKMGHYTSVFFCVPKSLCLHNFALLLMSSASNFIRRIHAYTDEPYPGILGNLSTPDKVWKTIPSYLCPEQIERLLFRMMPHKQQLYPEKWLCTDKGGKVTLRIKTKFIRKTANRSGESH